MPTPRKGYKTVSDATVMQFPTISNESVIESYLGHQAGRWRPATIRVRRLQLLRISRELGSLLTLDEERIIEWYDGLPGLPETRASYASALHGIFYWMSVLARPRLRTDNPTLIIQRPRIPVAQPRPMLDRHYDLALACAVSDPEMYVWLGLMGCSGLRCCEVAWLQVVDVEARDVGGYLHITGKGGKQRTVPVGEMLMLTMKPFLGVRGPVFTRPSDGKAHTPNAVSQRVSRFLREIGVPAPARAHSLRHRFGTDYHELDADLYTQAKLMGHGSVDTTQRYTAVSPVEAARHIEQLTLWRLRLDRRTGQRRRDLAAG